MKAIINTIAACALIASPFALAERYDHQEQAFDFARVTDVTPIYQTVKHRIPQEECWVETVRVESPQRHSASGAIVGGVVGGALGHAVGNGKKNKKIGVVVGSILGMSIGNDVSKRRQAQHHQNARFEEFERCETTYDTKVEERLTGYDVTYEYLGQHYSTHMQNHPGKKIRVAVHVRPVTD